MDSGEPANERVLVNRDIHLQKESDCAAGRRVLVRDFSDFKTTIWIGKRATFCEVAKQIKEALSLDHSADLVIRDSAEANNLPNTSPNTSEIAGEEKWVCTQAHWRMTWERMLGRCVREERGRLMVCFGVYMKIERKGHFR